jgi:hypothetical protein
MVVRHGYHATDTDLSVAYSVYATATKHTRRIQTCLRQSGSRGIQAVPTARVSTGPIDCIASYLCSTFYILHFDPLYSKIVQSSPQSIASLASCRRRCPPAGLPSAALRSPVGLPHSRRRPSSHAHRRPDCRTRAAGRPPALTTGRPPALAASRTAALRRGPSSRAHRRPDSRTHAAGRSPVVAMASLLR